MATLLTLPDELLERIFELIRRDAAQCTGYVDDNEQPLQDYGPGDNYANMLVR